MREGLRAVVPTMGKTNAQNNRPDWTRRPSK